MSGPEHLRPEAAEQPESSTKDPTAAAKEGAEQRMEASKPQTMPLPAYLRELEHKITNMQAHADYKKAVLNAIAQHEQPSFPPLLKRYVVWGLERKKEEWHVKDMRTNTTLMKIAYEQTGKGDYEKRWVPLPAGIVKAEEILQQKVHVLSENDLNEAGVNKLLPSWYQHKGQRVERLNVWSDKERNKLYQVETTIGGVPRIIGRVYYETRTQDVGGKRVRAEVPVLYFYNKPAYRFQKDMKQAGLEGLDDGQSARQWGANAVPY